MLIEVSEQVKRIDARVRPLDGAFKERPKVFQSVCVDVLFDVANGVIDLLVCIVRMESIVRAQRVSNPHL